jgi:hypothetical protein
MSREHSNHEESSHEESNNSERIDETIEVRRVAENGGAEDQIGDNEFEAEVSEEDSKEDQRRAQSQASEEGSRQDFEENFNHDEVVESDPHLDSSDLSETEQVPTLYFSQQETIISPSDSTWLNPEEESEEDKKLNNNNSQPKIQFTPAKVGSMDRSKSAPARPLTELEEFRGSNEFLTLEAAAMNAGDLLLKFNGRLDLDSVDGHNICKTFLNQIEQLVALFKAKCTSKRYRDKFSQTYKVLYKESSLCYLTEILDSAQEGNFQ